ncbi:MAG: PilZ domain-containing protein [Gammaproteobacteria bacterium]|nr:PilZ domain-containing protein [Gammaproteobacteria bacterium]
MAAPKPAERRALPRFDSQALEVWLRPRGRLVRYSGLAKDFNRHGFSVIVDQPIAKDVQVFVDLLFEDNRLDNVVGIVHNCIRVGDDYRVGIQFRTKSDLQFDQNYVENVLQRMQDTIGRSVLSD